MLLFENEPDKSPYEEGYKKGYTRGFDDGYNVATAEFIEKLEELKEKYNGRKVGKKHGSESINFR